MPVWAGLQYLQELEQRVGHSKLGYRTYQNMRELDLKVDSVGETCGLTFDRLQHPLVCARGRGW